MPHAGVPGSRALQGQHEEQVERAARDLAGRLGYTIEKRKPPRRKAKPRPDWSATDDPDILVLHKPKPMGTDFPFDWWLTDPSGAPALTGASIHGVLSYLEFLATYCCEETPPAQDVPP